MVALGLGHQDALDVGLPRKLICSWASCAPATVAPPR